MRARLAKWRTTAATFMAAAVLACGGIWVGVIWHGPLSLVRASQLSTIVLDRDGDLLRAYTAVDGRWRLPMTAADVDPLYLKMLLAFEDRRYQWHSGVDPIAVARAGAQALRYRRLVSGSSTLTMQVARLLDGLHEKTAAGKGRQMLRALALERQLSKTAILDLYLRLAPFGGNVEGVRAASLAYFSKEPKRLSAGEAALLVAIPQSPEARRPDRASPAAQRARDRVLALAFARGVISRADLETALRETVPRVRREFPRFAAHLADAEVALAPDQTVHRLAIDGQVQRRLEAAAREHAQHLGQGLSAAIVAVEHLSGRVVAYVGSSGYLDETRAGAVDMARAVRSPGSTLKPLIYGLAFEAGIAHPNTLIEDRLQRFGTYVPKNFDHDWHGTVTIREALAQSLNIPAVAVLDRLGPQRLFGRLQQAGLYPTLPGEAEPSLAIALGGLGLRLVDLAQLYAGIARGGEGVALGWRDDRDGSSATAGRVLNAAAAWQVADILKQAPPPALAKPGQIAFKTGTSYGYRDAWSVGFDGRHTIAVWVGRADGAAVSGLNGRQSAAPLLFDAFHRVSEKRVALLAKPSGVLSLHAGQALPPPLQRFKGRGDETHMADSGVFRDPPVAIAFPPDHAEIDGETVRSDGLIVKASGGLLPLTWLVNGAPILAASDTRQLTIADPGFGFLRVTVIDAKGRVDRVTVRVK